MATVEQRVKDIQSSWERERREEVFVEGGLFGMRDIDGTVIHRSSLSSGSAGITSCSFARMGLIAKRVQGASRMAICLRNLDLM